MSRAVIVQTPLAEYHGTVADDADLDGVFILTSTDEDDAGARYRVQGWNVTVTEEG